MRRDVFGKVKQDTTSGAKGKWRNPSKGSDRRRRGRSGAAKNMKAKWSKEIATNTKRNIFPGYDEIKSLIPGITESKETIYKEEEKELFRVKKEINDLISEMEQRNNETKTQ